MSFIPHLRTELHEERLDVVCAALIDSGARSVLDLGCGCGELLKRLAREPQFERIVGVDKCGVSLWQAQHALREYLESQPGRVSLQAASVTDRDAGLQGFDGCAIVETIEHIDPARLASVEQSVFGFYRPRTVAMTTPNAEFNVLFGLERKQFREADHRFEWEREKFRTWATGVAVRNGYKVSIGGIGEWDSLLGQPTQFALFIRLA